MFTIREVDLAATDIVRANKLTPKSSDLFIEKCIQKYLDGPHDSRLVPRLRARIQSAIEDAAGPRCDKGTSHHPDDCPSDGTCAYWRIVRKNY